ncbi:unnamed protein product [Mytilus edulis]|uniref:Uncharacterized protein n=1 Tax=Mytilus edulis TaxID=6550 RepID=A0A8S3QST5_MYTED|nr:unnamed protein product [Mytilus edulis]
MAPVQASKLKNELTVYKNLYPEKEENIKKPKFKAEMITEKEDTDGMFNTCTIDTILTIMAVLQLKIGKIHDFFKNSNHRIYKANSKLPQLLRDKGISDMRRLIDFGKRLDSRNYADDINNLLQQYVIKEEFVTDCAKCGFRRWDDVKEVVNCKYV